MPANLAEWVTSHYQLPIARVLVDGRVAPRVLDVSVDLGYDVQTPTARVSIASPVLPTWRPGQRVEISLGFGGAGGGLQPVFAGEIDDVDLAFFPHRVELAASGFLRRTQPPYYEGLAYSSVTDGFLWTEMLRKSGVPRYAALAAVDEGITYGGRKAVELTKGEAPISLIEQLDQSSPNGMRTWEIPGGVFRTRALGVPAANVAFRYGQGAVSHPVIRVLSVRRIDTTRELKNRVLVSGLPQDDGTEVFAERRADSPYVPNDLDGLMRDFAFSFSSKLIENRDHCDLVAQRYMTEYNRRKDEVELRGPLNPFLMPGATLGLTAPKIGLDTQRPYWIRHVRHSFGAGGAWSEAVLEGGAGDTGYLVGLDPVAAFTYTASSEAFLVGGVSQRMYTLVCDASPSFDPDGTIASYSWSASNGATGTGKVWTVAFTAAEWEVEGEEDEPPTVTLTVTDTDSDPTGPHSNTHTESISVEAEPLIVRTIYVAADGQADCTPDGGETWNTWVPASGRVISTPEIAPLDHSYFGLDNGELYWTNDALFSGAPTLVHDFPSGVRCIWVNEADATRVWVGLSNGQVWMTAEADLLDAAEWAMKADFPTAVEWVIESYAAENQVRVCTGGQVLISYDGLSTQGVLTTMAGGDCKRLALSFFGNYASGYSADAPVVEEDSSAVPFPGTPPEDVRITAFADRDSLLAVDETGQSWVKGEGATGFAATGAVGQGACGHVVRDGEQTAVFYAASAEGVAKSYDRGGTWLPLRDYAGTALTGLQIGYGAAPLEPPRRIRFFERTSNMSPYSAPPDNGTIVASICTRSWVEHFGPGQSDEPPAGWYERTFDDTVPWTGSTGIVHNWAPASDGISFGSNNRFHRAWDLWVGTTGDIYGHLPAYEDETVIFRHKFTVPDPGSDGPWAKLMVRAYNLWPPGSAGGPLQHGVPDIWLNGTKLNIGGIPIGGRAYIDPALLIADGTTLNVIAVRGRGNTSFIAGFRASWDLVGCTDDAVVSLSTEGDGALYWRPTGECLLAYYAPDDVVVIADWNTHATPGEIPPIGGWRCWNTHVFSPAIDHPLLGRIAQPGAYTGVSKGTVDRASWRHPIRLPVSSSGGPYRRATLTFRKGSSTTLTGSWLNTQEIDVRADGEYELDPQLLIPGAWNVLSFFSTAGGTSASWNPWISYVLRIEL